MLVLKILIIIPDILIIINSPRFRKQQFRPLHPRQLLPTHRTHLIPPQQRALIQVRVHILRNQHAPLMPIVRGLAGVDIAIATPKHLMRAMQIHVPDLRIAAGTLPQSDIAS